MGNPLGYDTAEELDQLHRTLAVTETYRPMLEGLTWPGHAGSKLARLDAAIDSEITVTETCVAGQQAAVGCVLHLAELLGSGRQPRAWVAVPLARTALVGSAHVIHTLGHDDPDVRVANARAVLRRQAGSHLSAIKDFGAFTHLSGLRPPEDLAGDLEATRSTIGGAGTPEGQMVSAMADSLAHSLVQGGYTTENLEALREHLTWVWHIWSGAAHAWAWPARVPGTSSELHAVAPGHWPTDFFQLTAITQQAVKLLVDALGPQP